MKKRNLFALLLVPAIGILGLTGCGSDKTVKDVKALYTEMSTTNNVTKDMFSESLTNLNYSVEVFNITSESQAGNINEDLEKSYVQLNTLYSSVLKVGSIYYNNHTADIIDNSESKATKGEINTLYNKLTTLKNSMSVLAEAKEKIEEKAELSGGSSTNAVQNLHGYNYTYSGTIASYLDFSNYYENLVEKYPASNFQILDNADATIAEKEQYINRLIDRATLDYANYVYYENIKAYCTNNSCDTLKLKTTAIALDNSAKLVSLLNASTVASARDFKHITATEDNIASMIAKAKTLYSLVTRYEQFFEFYKTAYSAINYNTYTLARIDDIENGNGNSVKAYVDTLSVKNQANVEIIKDFVSSDSVSFYLAISNLVA